METINKFWNQIEVLTNIPKDEFINAVKLILNSNYFQFNNNIYKQKFGVAMGQPLSSTIADLVMQNLEETILNNSTSISFYQRYVDDILVSSDPNNIENILNTFNNFHPRLQFTLEKEDSLSINFLDLTLYRNLNGAIETNWYRKIIKSNRYLNFHSNTTIKYKKSIINSLVDRAIILSSNKFHTTNINLIKNILIQNKYPIQFINKNITSRIRILKNRNNTQSVDLQPNCLGTEFNNSQIHDVLNYITLPYIPTLSLLIEKELKKYNLQIAYKNHNTIGQNFFNNLKDKTELTNQSNLVYQINCNNCKATYIGQTKQYFNKRISQHKNSINLKLKYPNKPNTALSDHAVDNLHNFNFASPKLLKSEKNLKKRLIYEMIEIKKDSNSVNYNTDIENLSTIYHNLF